MTLSQNKNTPGDEPQINTKRGHYIFKTFFALWAMTLFPISLFWLLKWVTPEQFSSVMYFDTKLSGLLTIFFSYSFLSIKAGLWTGNKSNGLKNVDGVVPLYAGNGMLFWVFSVIGTLAVSIFYQDIIIYTHENYLSLLFHLMSFGYLICLWMLYDGCQNTDNKIENAYYQNEMEEETKIFGSFNFLAPFYRYYRGMKFHPTILGVQIKQWINCRISLILWQIMVLIFFIYSNIINKFENNCLLLSAVLQSCYLCKFFHWELGYFNTLDITLDRAGFYICWGCLFVVPCVYLFPTWVLANHPCNANDTLFYILFAIGLFSVGMNYYIDKIKYDFQMFRQVIDKKSSQDNFTKIEEINFENEQFTIFTCKEGWKWLEGSKSDGSHAKLLLNNFWGLAKHSNYTFELIFTFIWSGSPLIVSGDFIYLVGLLYFGFLFVLLVHRTGRDDIKCSEKYGKMWRVYGNIVPKNYIPYMI